jgi:hypothetical protein
MEWNYQLVTRGEAGALTLAYFRAREEMEATLIRWMHRIISTQKSFRVTLQLQNEPLVPGNRLRIANRQPFEQLAKELKVVDEYVKSYGCPDMKLITNPSFPAGDDGRLFSFEVKELVLVRREHAFDAGRQVNVFGLQPA